MANYRVLNPHGDVVDTKDIASAEDAHAWFVDAKADNSELGWRMEVDVDGTWKFFDDTEGDRA
jgi:hypothetical protein